MEREDLGEPKPAKIGIGAGVFTKALARFVENIMMRCDDLEDYFDAKAAIKELDKQRKLTSNE